VRDDVLRALQCQLTQLTLLPKGTNNDNEEQLRKAHDAILQSLQHGQQHVMEELEKISARQHKSLEEILSMRIERKCQTLLTSLQFQGMDRRKDTIPESAQSTLSWVFEEETSPLQDWLQQEHPIFCIFGKPGSGKSTMMRFLSRDERTRVALETWSADSLLIMADHYFWYPGEAMQRSHQGLLQSLLYGILAEATSLAPFICPQRWKTDDLSARRPWTREELLNSMKNLRHINNAKVFLLIDGLDEYYPHDNHRLLLEDLDALSKIPNLKICVSSRHWPVFEKTFRSSPKLSLEDHNCDDVLSYAFCELRHTIAICSSGNESLDIDTARQLAKEIAHNADGVFLWAYLVVRALSERLSAGELVPQLQRCLRQFPRDLHDYFNTMIYQRISSTWREGSETAQALKIAMILAQSNQHSTALVEEKINRRSFLNYWFLCTDQGLQNHNFAIERQVAHVSTHDMLGMVERTRNFISHCAKDLLTFSTNGISQFEFDKATVDFAHRTVHDYLLTVDMQELINRQVPPHFLCTDFVSNLALARFKVIPAANDRVLCIYHAEFIHQYWIIDPQPKVSQLLDEIDIVAFEYPQIDERFSRRQSSPRRYGRVELMDEGCAPSSRQSLSSLLTVGTKAEPMDEGQAHSSSTQSLSSSLPNWTKVDDNMLDNNDWTGVDYNVPTLLPVFGDVTDYLSTEDDDVDTPTDSSPTDYSPPKPNSSYLHDWKVVRIVDFLISNGRNQLAHKVLRALPASQRHPEWANEFIFASLGNSGCLIYGEMPLDAINIRLVSVILNGGASPNMKSQKFRTLGRSAWHLFLRSWVRIAWPHNFTPELGAQLSNIRTRIPNIDDQLWPIANLLLSKGANVAERCCVGTSTRCGSYYSDHECRFYSVDDILRTCLLKAYDTYLEKSEKRTCSLKAYDTDLDESEKRTSKRLKHS
jgi:hypothetical protein